MTNHRQPSASDSMLRIDEDDLIDALSDHNPDVSWYLNQQSGEVIPVFRDMFFPGDEEYIDEEALSEDPRYLLVEPLSSRDGYRWMEKFSAQVDDADLRRRLERALDRPRPFRGFKDVLYDYPAERDQWFEYERLRQREAAQEWLTFNGITAELVSKRPPPQPSEDPTDLPSARRVVSSEQAPYVDLGSFGARFLARAEDTQGAVAIVEHPIPPRTLAAPLHRHAREDEYSYVVEGRMGARLGEKVVYAEAGTLVFKPRGEWHTFWNAGDGPCRVLEIITPGGFEEMFAEMGADPELMAGEGATAMDARYGLEVDYESIERLCREHGLSFPESE